MRLLRTLAWAAAAMVCIATPGVAGTCASAADWKALKAKIGRDLASDDQDARLRAIRKLGLADWPDAVKLLLKMLRAPDVRTDALEKRFEKLTGFLLQIEKSVKDRGMKITVDEKKNRLLYLAELAELRRTLNAVGATKRVLVEALGRTQSAEGSKLIVEATEKERDPVLKAHLVVALGTVPCPDAADVVRAALTQDGSAWVRTAALEAMAARGTAEDLTLMLGALADEAWPVRAAAVDAIGTLGKAAFPAAVEPLIALLGTETGRLQGDIAAVLTKLTGGQVGPDQELWQSWWTANKEKLLAGSAEEAAEGAEAEGQKAHGTTAKFYGIPTTSKRIAFVVDLSGSMNEAANAPAGAAAGGGAPAGVGPPADDPSQKPLPASPTKLDVLKRELMRAIWQLPEDAVFALVGYHFEAALLGRGIQKATVANKTETGRVVDAWVADGGTNTHEALLVALGLGQDPRNPVKKFAEGVDTIFLLSDGLPGFGKMVDPDEIVGDITARVKTRRVRIHTIWVDTADPGDSPAAQRQSEQGGRFMKELAEKTGGTFVKR